MLVDNKLNFLSQRWLPELTTIKTEFNVANSNGLKVSKEGLGEIIITENSIMNIKVNTILWGQNIPALKVSETVNEWFSDLLKQPVLLLYLDYVNSEKSFTDTAPVHIISTASINYLNSLLSEPISYKRFRPNLVLQHSTPFIEDELTDFNVNGIQFNFIKKCARCTVPNVNQNTGKISKEPMKTLNNIRRFGGKVYFGSLFKNLNNGKISVGNDIAT